MTSKLWMLAALIAGVSAPVLAVAENFTVDPDHTYPSLEFSHMGISVWRGKFNKTSGKITLDRAARTGSADIQVDVASIDFGLDKMNQHALTADWLNAGKFPTMSYKGAIRFEGDMPVSVDGQLTLLGVTKPLTLKIERWVCKPHPFNKKPMCGGNASGAFKRTDFGMKYGVPAVGDEIRLFIEFEGYKQ